MCSKEFVLAEHVSKYDSQTFEWHLKCDVCMHGSG